MSNRKTYRILSAVLALLLMLVLAVASCTEEAAPAPTTPTPTPTPEIKHIPVGSVMGLTGPLAVPCLAFNPAGSSMPTR